MKDLQIILMLISSFIISCNPGQENKKDDKTVVENEKLSPKIETRIFRNDTIPGSNLTGFGYDILLEGKVYIHQPHIPSISGSKGFSSENDARKTAEYVAEKLRETNALSSLRKEEPDNLGIKY